MINTKAATIHIAIAFDQNFKTPAYTLLASIFDNNKNNSLEIHAIATGVDNKTKKEIEQYVIKNKSIISFYEINQSSAEKFIIPKNTHFTSATYYRLYFPSLIPEEVTKLLYLDTDIIVIGDLSKLYNIDITSLPVAAAPDITEAVRPELGIIDEGNYFNAGVLLINIREWKTQNISERAIEFLLLNPEKIKWVDQDALNAILKNNWHKLETKFNVTFYDIPPDLPKKDYASFLEDKVIIHYTTHHKPWLTLGENKLRFLYHYYLKKSKQPSHKKYIDFRYSKSLIKKFVRIRIVEALLDYPKLVKYLRNLK